MSIYFPSGIPHTRAYEYNIMHSWLSFCISGLNEYINYHIPSETTSGLITNTDKHIHGCRLSFMVWGQGMNNNQIPSPLYELHTCYDRIHGIILSCCKTLQAYKWIMFRFIKCDHTFTSVCPVGTRFIHCGRIERKLVSFSFTSITKHYRKSLQKANIVSVFSKILFYNISLMNALCM